MENLSFFIFLMLLFYAQESQGGRRFPLLLKEMLFCTSRLHGIHKYNPLHHTGDNDKVDEQEDGDEVDGEVWSLEDEPAIGIFGGDGVALAFSCLSVFLTCSHGQAVGGD